MNPVEKYFQDLRDIRSTGAAVPETSYYGALESLLNEIGRTMNPKVRCVINIANRGVGIPDGGLFTESQFQRLDLGKPMGGQLPERGVVEVKPTGDDAWVTSSGEQVTRYWGEYGLVLVTNYRDFVLVGRDSQGRAERLETYRLADTESDFWGMVAHPKRADKQQGERLTEYLKRVLLHAAPITSPEDVAWFLASYARDSRARIEGAELPSLNTVRQALEDALGLKFEGEKGEHFFRSTLIQTLFYGVFSAWVLWSKDLSPNDNSSRFDWRIAAWSLRIPMIRVLFEQIATPQLGSLGLVEPLDWASAVLNRVDRPRFFSTFDQGYAVQYFYEPFLEQLDPELRKTLGVWYTPPEIVKYMVARVDTVLRQELDIPDGLADPRVVVLDPCCGTGTYLIEAIRLIARTIKEKHGDALAPQEIKKAAMERIYGFEILPAPFIVAHLQMDLLLQQLQAPFLQEKSERASIYLTNALTGWTSQEEASHQAFFPELEKERSASEGVKRARPILVVLGNPPYDAFAGVSSAEEDHVVDLYKEGLNEPVSRGGWGIKKFNLDDLYIRFFRIAERRIVDGEPGYGIVCFISNFSFLRRDSYVVMRQRFAKEFDSVWLDCMNGDSRETGKLTPDGGSDPSVFSTDYHPVGIRVGTVISLFARKPQRSEKMSIRYRDFWGVAKRADLLKSLQVADFDKQYEQIQPSKQNRYLFHPTAEGGRYEHWPKLTDLSREAPINGLMEKRGGGLIDIDRTKIEERMQRYFDKNVDWDTFVLGNSKLTENAAGFTAKEVRQKLLNSEQYQAERVVPYALRPYDTRWCYYSSVNPLWNRSRPKLWGQYRKKNGFVMSRPTGVASPEGIPFFFTRLLGDNDFLRGHAYYIPIKLFQDEGDGSTLFPKAQSGLDWEANLSPKAISYLMDLGIASLEDEDSASLVWMHVLAIGFSPSYLLENEDGIRRDWPRIPMPQSKELLASSALMGKRIADLLDSKSVDGVNSGQIKQELSIIGSVSRKDEGAIDLNAGDLDVTAHWGSIGKDGAVMPGPGIVVWRNYAEDELKQLANGAILLGMSLREITDLLGPRVLDVYLNENVFWSGIPEKVWGFTIGGYQVLKKWLSYREKRVLGRGLSVDEAREVTVIARRIASLVLMHPSLNENYTLSKNSAVDWLNTSESIGARDLPSSLGAIS